MIAWVTGWARAERAAGIPASSHRGFEDWGPVDTESQARPHCPAVDPFVTRARTPRFRPRPIHAEHGKRGVRSPSPWTTPGRRLLALAAATRPSRRSRSDLARCTRRRSNSTKNRTYSRVSPTVSTVRKSQASDPAAWARKNAVQPGPPRRGAGPSRCRCRIRRTDVADTRTPSLRHSPTILR
jgi:hypothetical protein